MDPTELRETRAVITRAVNRLSSVIQRAGGTADPLTIGALR